MRSFLFISLLNSVLNLLFIFQSVDHLGISAYGEFSLLFALVGLISVLLNLQTWQWIYDAGQRFEEVASSARHQDLKSNMLGVFVAATLAVYFYFYGKVFASALCLTLCVGAHSAYYAILRARGHRVLSVLNKTPFSIFRVAFLSLLEDGELTPLMLATLIAGSEILSVLLLISLERFTRPVCMETPAREVPRHSKFAAYKSALIDLPVSYLDVIIVGARSELEVTGLYKIAKSVLGYVMLCLKPLIDWYTPLVTRDPNFNLQNYFKIVALIVCVAALFMSTLPATMTLIGYNSLSINAFLSITYIIPIVGAFLFLSSFNLLKARMYGRQLHDVDVKFLAFANFSLLILLWCFAPCGSIKTLLLCVCLQAFLLSFFRIIRLMHEF